MSIGGKTESGRRAVSNAMKELSHPPPTDAQGAAAPTNAEEPERTDV
jgi:hypothetical protein